MTVRVLGLSGSLRAKSTNRGLLRYAQAHAPSGMKIHIADLLDVPFYNADLAEKPPAVQHLLHEFAEADALLLACTEYNYSIAPALKNALDWASREPDNHLLRGKAAALIGAGGGMGTARAQYHLRQICVYLDLQVMTKPEFFASAFNNNFDTDGSLQDEKLQEKLLQSLQGLQDWHQQLHGIS
ncbi:NADPH-dependent FMN reductase [Alkalimonas delamerensis]|uniref:NADPH-dependent FMN reductase n=1 Tax=Alkalimonas delamerensis TaxID=265981 RepID=A0ABT9GTC7_9GAMM|nr:NADPH-dependent FMN reductase [Alkalimonas delamerensis]MDP4529886.1 NADPH-dependent FMN reductase [Alkalimonas delamerensis]